MQINKVLLIENLEIDNIGLVRQTKFSQFANLYNYPLAQ